MLILAEMPTWLIGILVALFLVVCVMLILTVLIQRPAGGGLSGAFGSGAGSGQTAFGAKTGDALTIATIAIFVVYLLFAIGLNFGARPSKVVIIPTASGANGGTGSTGSTPASTGPTAPTAPTSAPPPATTGATGATTPPPAPTAAPTGTTGATTPPAPTGSTGATGR